MSTLFLGNFVQFFDDDGNPLSGGTVTFYEPGTSTKKDVYTTSDLSTPASNPVILDSAGRVKVWLNGDYKVRVKDSVGTVVQTADGINPDETTETSNGSIIPNGSFDTAGNSTSDVDGWTLTAQNDGTVERITSDNYEGDASLKFTSTGNGGGQADTNAFFAVSPGRQYEVYFALKCSVADIRNIVQLRYFDADQSFLSNSTIYDENTSNPTSWEIKRLTETPPSNARFAKFRILGADQSDATTGEAKFDMVSMFARSTLQPGFIQMYGGSSEPSGWLFCNGQAVSRTTYVDLFNVLGTTFGNGDGSSTFNVPDLRDRFPLGTATIGGSDAGRVGTASTGLGDSGGEDEHTLTTGEMPNHDHGGGNHDHALRNRDDVTNPSSGSDSKFSRGGSGAYNDAGGTQTSTGAVQNSGSIINSEGGDSAHNNMPPFLAINFVIKT